MTYVILKEVFYAILRKKTGETIMQIKELTREQRATALEYGLDPNDCVRLCYRDKEIIINEGMKMEYLFILVKGVMRISRSTTEGNELILSFNKSGSIIGDVEISLGSTLSTATMIAQGNCECIGLPLYGYAEKVRGNITFMCNIARQLAEKILSRNDANIIITLYPVEGRLCTYILQTSVDGVFSGLLTETAKMIAASYRQLLRVMSSLCSDGIIKKTKRGYEIIDRERLEEKSAAGFHWDLNSPTAH